MTIDTMTEGRAMEHSPMPWKYLEKTGFVVDANGAHIAQTWNRKDEDFANAKANGNAIARLTAENARLREQLNELTTENIKMRTRLAEAYNWFESAPISYSNNVEHSGIDEGDVIGWEQHREIKKRIELLLGWNHDNPDA